MHIKYNAPVTLTFSLICFSVVLLNQYLDHHLIRSYFALGGRGSFNPHDILDYVRLFSYTMGHSGWEHLIGNISFLLLLGPILEEKHGSRFLLIMMLVTALATAGVNLFFSAFGLMGASGIVFMFILLSSFTNIRKGEVPLTFVFIFIIYVTKEIASSFQHNSISEMAHIIGGVCGAVFGFISQRK
jgi:rhomboid protease GluP